VPISPDVAKGVETALWMAAIWQTIALGAGLSGGHMKTIIAVLALVAVSAVPASANMCIRQRDIAGTSSKDGKTMTFRMNDGRVLVNHLQGNCSDLRFEGFAWNVPGTQDICEYQQSLHVLQSGQICVLGKFDVVKDKPAAPAH
jgi:hypothetical protein